MGLCLVMTTIPSMAHNLDGISLTYGTPRKHIWSFALSASEYSGRYSCPCSSRRGTRPLPFVREHYYCDSGSIERVAYEDYYTDDPLWDGKGCSSVDTCCGDHMVLPSNSNENY